MVEHDNWCHCGHHNVGNILYTITQKTPKQNQNQVVMPGQCFDEFSKIFLMVMIYDKYIFQVNCLVKRVNMNIWVTVLFNSLLLSLVIMWRHRGMTYIDLVLEPYTCISFDE